MTRLALVNMNCYRTALGRTQLKIEPVHLLPMHNIARKHGLESRIFQFDPANPAASRREIKAFSPEILGLSFIGHSGEAIEQAEKLIASFSKPRPILLVGGTDVKPHDGIYYDRFGRFYPYSQDKTAYAVIVPGAGERILEALTEADFDFFKALDLLRSYDRPEVLDNGMAFGGGMMVNGNVYYLLGNYSPLPLAEQSFERDYSLAAFADRAQVKWSAGCWGKCFFCSNEPDNIERRSEELVREEMRQLISAGVKQVKIASANFTADPKWAARIISDLPVLPEGYYFASRVDSLYRSILHDPAAWQHFAEVGEQIELGVESLVPERLVRLGKCRNLAEAEKYLRQLDHILGFFAGTKINLNFFLIPFDWQLTMEEALAENERLQGVWDKYPWGVRVTVEVLSNLAHYVPGSRWAEKMKEDDFYRFEDPRLLFAALILREKSSDPLFPSGWRNIEKLALSRLMLQYQRTVYRILSRLPVERLQIEPALSAFVKKRDERAMLNALYRQLGFFEWRRLRQEFAREFKKIFTGLDREVKALAAAMIDERIIGQQIAGKIKEIFLQALKS